MRISDWSSDVCSSDLIATQKAASLPAKAGVGGETRPRGPAPVAGGTAGRNEVEHPERSEGLPQAASGLAGSAARTRLIGRGTSNAAARSAASIVTPAIVTPWPRPVRGSAETGALAAVGVERGRTNVRGAHPILL